MPARSAAAQPVGWDKWHLDEAVLSIRGKKHWLWRAVDQNGLVLEVLVQSRRNAKAAKRPTYPELAASLTVPLDVCNDDLAFTVWGNGALPVSG